MGDYAQQKAEALAAMLLKECLIDTTDRAGSAIEFYPEGIDAIADAMREAMLMARKSAMEEIITILAAEPEQT